MNHLQEQLGSSINSQPVLTSSSMIPQIVLPLMVVGDVGKIFKLEEKNDAMTQEIILSSLLVDFWEGLPVLLLFEVDT